MSIFLSEKVSNIFEKLNNPPDLKVRYMHKKEVCLLYFEGIVDITLVQESVIKPISEQKSERLSLNKIIESLTSINITILNDQTDILNKLLNGSVILFEDNTEQVLEVNLKKVDKRQIESPDIEVTIRGPKDGFVEDISTNRTLIRRRLKTEKLKIISINIGKYSNIPLELYYLDGVAELDLVRDILNKLHTLKLDYITDSSFIEKHLDRRKVKILPIIENVQRPDTVVSNLVEGRIAILIDGSPDALILPAIFAQFIESPGDYYDNIFFSSFAKVLRLIALFLSITLPGIYVAVTTFHWGLIPAQLLITFASARAGVPYPIIIELLLLEFVFEILREAGLRFPKSLGQVISIVGALVIGDAAVQAGLVSAPTVIVVAFTGIASYIVPKYSFGSTVRLLRFPLLVMATIAGLPGLLMSMTVVMTYFVSIKSFGMDYMSPVSRSHFDSTRRWLFSTYKTNK